jgi:hypothetical protein
LERARENRKGRRRGGWRGWGRAGILVVENKRRGSATRAFLDRAAAKPRESNRTAEITQSILGFGDKYSHLRF